MDEQLTPQANETENSGDWKHHFTTVTPLSKFLATVLFVLLPFVGFAIGLKYARSLVTTDNLASQSLSPTSISTSQEKLTYTEENLGFQFQYPQGTSVVVANDIPFGDENITNYQIFDPQHTKTDQGVPVGLPEILISFFPTREVFDTYKDLVTTFDDHTPWVTSTNTGGYTAISTFVTRRVEGEVEQAWYAFVEFDSTHFFVISARISHEPIARDIVDSLVPISNTKEQK